MSYPTASCPSIPILTTKVTPTMTEHRIRFRMGWELHHEQSAEIDKNFAFPTAWSETLKGKIRLIRRFGRPRPGSASESYRIEIRQTPGLISARLNDQPLELEVRANVDLLKRNTLELEVDLDQIPRRSPPDLWGDVALVIRSDG